MASATFSHNFIIHVRLLYDLSLNQMVSGDVSRHGLNCYTDYAGPAYVSAVASIEALINEIALGDMARLLISDSPLWDLDQDWVEKLEILHKLIIIPQLLFGNSFKRGNQPYQDMRLLIKVRNDFVHFKMKDKAPRYIKPLQDRGIALPAHPKGGDYIWVHKLSSSEGIRWANNTVYQVAKALVDFIPDEHRDFLFAFLAQNFIEISLDRARQKLIQSGIDPDDPGLT